MSLILAGVLAGCAAVGQDYQSPEPGVPEGWRGPALPGALDDVVLARWWRSFDDPVLDGLIRDALAANKDLDAALAALREARARRDAARAQLAPTSSASGSLRHSETSGEDGSGRELYSTSLDASWEPDVFGAGRRALEAAEADFDGSLELWRDTRVMLVSEVARVYVELRAAERRLDIAQRNLAAQSELRELTRWRREAGLVSELDESRIVTLLEQTRAAMPGLRTAIAASRYRLDVLLGRPPGSEDARLRDSGAIPVADIRVAAGIPADTLRQRPDVRAAERRLAAQTARLGEAEAARYPSVRLTGSIGLEALSAGALFDGGAGTRSLLAGITAPLFDAGRIRSNIEVRDALVAQARIAWESAVLTALEEVENALISLANTAQRYERLTLAAASSRRALAYARQQYAAGLIDFQTVLDSQRTVLDIEDQLAASRGEQSIALIRLYKALGGGWAMDDPANMNSETSS
ncbi:MAG TPA: efflux transporter outer membrane subunit [Arenicellales bacterium]|nr:efflux transporter outer membrane subunit [Arenicellales bacterium]